MPDYMRMLWQSGQCPYLVPASFYRDESGYKTLLKTEGLINVYAYAAQCPDGIEDGFCMLLQMLSSTAQSVWGLQQWLAEPAYISLRPNHLFYEPKTKRSLLLLHFEADVRPFWRRFCECCEGLGPSGDLIATRLASACSSRILEEKGVAAFLRDWQRTILQGL